MTCTNCGTGNLRESTIDVCMHKGERLALFRNVPGLVCDQCGDESLGMDVAARLERLFHRREPPTGFKSALVYDLDELDQQKEVRDSSRILPESEPELLSVFKKEPEYDYDLVGIGV